MLCVHVAPVYDDRHVLQGDRCWCKPVIRLHDREGGEDYTRPLVLHNAALGYNARTPPDRWGVFDEEDAA